MHKNEVNIAFDYFPSSFSTNNKKLMGLQSANEGFLKGFLRHGNLPSYACHVRNRIEAESFSSLVKEVCDSNKSIIHIAPGEHQKLADVGALLHPFPGFGNLAWTRNFHSSASYSILGITHTTATQAVMDSIGNLSISPIQSWDAVVCTSSAVRHTYETVLDFWEDYLKSRLGAKKLPRPQLPIIPLGVDTSKIKPNNIETKENLRAELNIPKNAFVVLWVGRFSHIAKSHPIPAYLTLERLAKKLEKPIVYLQAGWFENSSIQQAFTDASKLWSPSVKNIFVDGRSPYIRKNIWHIADVFLSLSDNLQETFGLTPIEAMAAELPVVVSDWDGYRDTVRDGVDGFRIKTIMPAPGYGSQLAKHYCSNKIQYGLYCGITSQSVSVDLNHAVRVLELLAKNPTLCKKMGQSGRERALTRFDWSVVVNQYLELISELNKRRLKEKNSTDSTSNLRSMNAPLREDPFTIFSGYPTKTINSSTQYRLSNEYRLMCSNQRSETFLDALHNDQLNSFASNWRLPIDKIKLVLELFERDSELSVENIVSRGIISSQKHESQKLIYTLGWLLKMGLLEDNF